jgi:hypothetical protein
VKCVAGTPLPRPPWNMQFTMFLTANKVGNTCVEFESDVTFSLNKAFFLNFPTPEIKLKYSITIKTCLVKKEQENIVSYSPPTIAEVKNMRSYTSIYLYIFVSSF